MQRSLVTVFFPSYKWTNIRKNNYSGTLCILIRHILTGDKRLIILGERGKEALGREMKDFLEFLVMFKKNPPKSIRYSKRKARYIN